VGEKFIVGKVHVDTPLSADVGSVAVRWIRRFYVGMIAFVIGGMFSATISLSGGVRRLSGASRILVWSPV
jgi:hypothetical protein